MSLIERLKVFTVVGAVIAISTYQVMSAVKTKEGHDALSSEKPASLRGEVERDFAVEKAKVIAADARKAALLK